MLSLETTDFIVDRKLVLLSPKDGAPVKLSRFTVDVPIRTKLGIDEFQVGPFFVYLSGMQEAFLYEVSKVKVHWPFFSFR